MMSLCPAFNSEFDNMKTPNRPRLTPLTSSPKNSAPQDSIPKNSKNSIPKDSISDVKCHSNHQANNKHKFNDRHIRCYVRRWVRRWALTMMMAISICLLLIILLLSHHKSAHDKTAHGQTHVSTNTDVNSMPANDTAHTATALKTQSEIIIKDMTNKDMTKNATTENSPAQDDLAKNNLENNRLENGNLENHQPKRHNNSPILPIIASHDANHDVNTTISNSNSGQTTNTQINEQIKQIDERHHAQQQAIKDEHLLSWDLPSNVQQQNRELLTDIALQDQSNLEAQRQIQDMKRQLNDANAKMSEQLEQIRKLAQQQIEQDSAGN